MLDHNEIETVDAEPVLALDTTVEGLPAGLHAHLAAELAELLEDAERYAAAAQAINTTRAYASDWKQFQAWCERYRLERARPAEAPRRRRRTRYCQSNASAGEARAARRARSRRCPNALVIPRKRP